MRSYPTKAILAAALLLALSVLLLPAVQVQAKQPYDAKAFEAAQAADKTVLLHVHASWCPVCKRQEPTVARLEKEKPDLIVYVVDFDGDKATLKKLGVTSQSTLIVFKGTEEVGRATGVTDASQIEALVSKGF